MPITQTMTFTATPPTTGETPTTFNYNAIACWNELKLNVVPDLNTAFTEMNALETNVNAKEASAVASAEAAVSAANFKGNWSNATSYTIGDSVLYLGITYKAILSGSNQNPSTANTYWSPLSIASSIKYTPSVEVSATTVQGAIDELSTEKLSVFNIHTATDKTTPIDADEFPLIDSASSFTLKKLSWTNIKATLKSYFDTIYVALSGDQTITGVKTFSSSPIAPTATAGDNSTKLSTTEFVTGRKVILTPVSATGTSVDITGIPSWAKSVKVMFNGVSTNGTADILIQLGSTTVQTTGYLGSGSVVGSTTSTALSTAGFILATASAANVRSGALTISKFDTNAYVADGSFGRSNAGGVEIAGGYVSLAGNIDRIRVTTSNGTDTFDLGTINISYEG